MQDYDFEFLYRPGAHVSHVDYLSQNPIEVMRIGITDNEWIRAAQSQDPDIEVVRNFGNTTGSKVCESSLPST